MLPSRQSATAPPAAKPAEKPATIDALLAAAAKPPAVKPPIAKPAAPSPSQAPVKAASTETVGAVVQIGAFSSESLADKEWSKAAAAAPGPMAGKGKRVVPVATEGGKLYRTSITGFASRDQAVALCDRLKAAGGSCFVR